MLRVLNKAYEHPIKTEEHAAMPLAGGILQHGYQCGMIWGSALAAGAQAYRVFGPGAKAETYAIQAAKRLVASFRELNDHINCLEITEIDRTSSTMDMIVYFLIKGGTIGCFKRVAKYAPIAFEEINSSFQGEDTSIPTPPVSCTSVLIGKMGGSDLHQTMAAGLAGGIGLCGGGCGALGAAIWFLGRNVKKMDFSNPQLMKVIEQFIKHTDYEFECSKITGQSFANISEHADYIHNKGCAELIDILVSN